MKSSLPALLLILIIGCTTTPQADVMDTVFKSRNACSSLAQQQGVQYGPSGALTHFVPTSPDCAAPIAQPVAEPAKKKGLFSWFRR